MDGVGRRMDRREGYIRTEGRVTVRKVGGAWSAFGGCTSSGNAGQFVMGFSDGLVIGGVGFGEEKRLMEVFGDELGGGWRGEGERGRGSEGTGEGVMSGLDISKLVAEDRESRREGGRRHRGRVNGVW